MTNVISTLLHWLEQRSERVTGNDEMLRRESLLGPESGIEEAVWLQRYLFDREWRADVEAASQGA